MENSNKAQVSGGNLDISQVADTELDQLAQSIEQFYKQDSSAKSRLAYNWDRNHMFLDGNQWLVFDGNQETGGTWKRLEVSKANEYIPRPVTNHLIDGYQTLKSYLIKNKPRSSVRPNTQTFRDKSAAKIADLCLEANWERLNETANYETAAANLVTYGTVFKKSYWDTSPITMSRVPRMEMRPKLDPTTGMQIGEEEVQAIDPMTGDPIVDEFPLGDVNTAVVEPYRIALDPGASDLHKAKWIMEYSIQSIDWIRSTYDKQEPGYTGRVAEVKEESSLSGVMKRLQNLKGSSGVKTSGAALEASSGHTGDEKVANSAVVKEYYSEPSSTHPKGRMVVVANGVPLYAGESPYTGTELGDWHPYSECRWEIMPGRFWGKSPLDSGCEIQKRINSIHAVIALTRKTMAIPQKLIPTSAGIPKGTWTGRPGQEIEYRDSGGAIPSVVPAAGVDPTVFQELQTCVEDLKTIMGNMDILKGDRPPGVNAASALNLLYEVGTGKLYPVLDRWKKFVESDQKKQLKIIAARYKEPRPQFVALLKSKNSDLSEQAIERFLGSDLYDNCNVIVEAGSNIPKLQAARQAALQEAAQTGALNLELPANRIEYQRQMGIVGFDNDVGPDTKRAEWENDCLDNIEQEPDRKPMVLAVDDDAIHMEVLAKRMKEPSFMSAPMAVQQAYMLHYQEHMDSQAQKETAAAMNAMATGQPPEQGQDGTMPTPISSAGKGVSPKMSNALRSDAIVPGQPS